QGGSMRSPRTATPLLVILAVILAASVAGQTSSTAQQKPKPEPSPSPSPSDKNQLLNVQPAPVQAPEKSQQPSSKILLPQGEVDDKNPVITNTDLITFTVTVTDIYGRFVSGLNKNAFTIAD